MDHIEKNNTYLEKIFFKCVRSSRILWNWRKEIKTDCR